MPTRDGGTAPARKVVVALRRPAPSFKAQRSRGRRVLPEAGKQLEEAEFEGGEKYVRVSD